jgi:OOP family OmpA-OmpF porin
MKSLRIAGTIALAVAAGSAAAQSAGPQPGLYGDLNLGWSHLGTSSSDINGVFAKQGITGTSRLDRNQGAWGLNLGYNLNQYWGLEGGYSDFGSFKYSMPTTAPAVDTVNGKYKAHAWSFAGVGRLPLATNWSLYGKFGYERSYAKLDATSSTAATTPASGSANRNGVLIGAGVTYDFNKSWYGKLGWDHYTRVGNDNNTGSGAMDVAGVGFGIHF